MPGSSKKLSPKKKNARSVKQKEASSSDEEEEIVVVTPRPRAGLALKNGEGARPAPSKEIKKAKPSRREETSDEEEPPQISSKPNLSKKMSSQKKAVTKSSKSPSSDESFDAKVPPSKKMAPKKLSAAPKEEKSLEQGSCTTLIADLEQLSVHPGWSSESMVALSEEKVYKFMLADTSYPHNSLLTERRIYNEIIPSLKKETPHLVEALAYFSCDDLLTELRKALSDPGRPKTRHIAAQLHKGLTRIITTHPGSNTVNILVTTRAAGMTLERWLDSALYQEYFTKSEKDDFDLQVARQVAQALFIAKKKRLMHNDLHLNNINVVELETKRKMPYLVQGKAFFVKYYVQFYDFDHASVEGKINNTWLDKSMCRLYGECNTYTDKWDWFTFLDFYVANKPDTILAEHFGMAEELGPGETFGIKGKRPFRGRAAICQDNKCNSCVKDQSYLDSVTSLEDFLGYTH